MELQKHKCSLCGTEVSPSQIMMVNNVSVCENCKPVYVQALQEGAPMQQTFPQIPAVNPKKPLFCTIVFSVDLALCLIRGLFVLLSIAGLFMMRSQNPDDPMLKTVYLEVSSGFFIFLFGVSGNIALLMKKQFGIVLGILNMAATLLSIICGIWQALLQFRDFEVGTPEFIGAVAGITITILFRFFLFGALGVALYKFSQWYKYEFQPVADERARFPTPH